MKLASENEPTVALGDFVLPVWRRLWMVMLIVLVVVGTAIGFTLAQTPVYEASVKILVGQEGKEEVPGSLYGDVEGLQQLTQTMVELVATRPVAEAVIDRLDLRISSEEFLENLSVQQIGTTQVMEVSYRHENPEEAKQIADAVGDVFAQQVSEVSPSASAITATVWERSPVPEESVSSTLLRNALAALAVGLMLGIGLAFLLEYLDDSWRSPEELEQVTGVPTFAVVPLFKAPKGNKEFG